MLCQQKHFFIKHIYTSMSWSILDPWESLQALTNAMESLSCGFIIHLESSKGQFLNLIKYLWSTLPYCNLVLVLENALTIQNLLKLVKFKGFFIKRLCGRRTLEWFQKAYMKGIMNFLVRWQLEPISHLINLFVSLKWAIIAVR